MKPGMTKGQPKMNQQSRKAPARLAAGFAKGLAATAAKRPAATTAKRPAASLAKAVFQQTSSKRSTGTQKRRDQRSFLGLVVLAIIIVLLVMWFVNNQKSGDTTSESSLPFGLTEQKTVMLAGLEMATLLEPELGSGQAWLDALAADVVGNGQMPGASMEALPPGESVDCPVPLAEFCTEVLFEQAASFGVWWGLAQLDIEDAAGWLLEILAGTGWSLHEYGYMDLFSDVWGCVVSRNDQEVLVITVMARDKNAQVTQSNPMIIRIAHLTVEELSNVL
jgi:hypothetical protein